VWEEPTSKSAHGSGGLSRKSSGRGNFATLILGRVL
jgi:hypothetical protein